LQALAVVFAVYPELMELQVDLERTRGILAKNFPAARGNDKRSILAVVRTAKIEIPPMLLRSFDNFFIVEPVGAGLIQAVSFTHQYNGLIDTLVRRIDENPNVFDTAEHLENLTGHLTAIGRAVADALREIEPLHDEAVPAA
jgi:hypothetical protein